MTKPDFKIWAENIILVVQRYGTAQESIETALEQAYNQGYYLGLNNGWAIEQDNDLAQLGMQDRKIEGKPWRRYP